MGNKKIHSYNGWISTAEGFIIAGNACNTDKGIDYFRYYIAPKTVNYSIACELLLKLLCSLTNDGQYPPEHALMDLYDNIDDQIKKAVISEYNKQTELYKSKYLSPQQDNLLLSFENCIAKHNNAFVEWRYLYESKPHNISVEPCSLYCLAISLLSVAKANLQE